MPLPELIEIVPFSKEQLRSFQWKKAEIMVPGSKSSWAIYTILSSEKFIVFAGCFFLLFWGDGIGVLLEHLSQKKNRWLCLCLRRFRHFSTSSVEFYEFHLTWPNTGSLGTTRAFYQVFFIPIFLGWRELPRGKVVELRHHKPSYLSGEAFFFGMLFGADDEVYFSVNQGRPFLLGGLGWTFLNISLRLDLEPAMNGMECIFSGFCV